jgi:hypothetical protein
LSADSTPLYLALASLLIAVAGLIPLYVDMYFRRQEKNRITVSIERFQNQNKEWFVRIQQPDKLVGRLNVMCDGKPCFLKDPPTKIPQTEVNLRAGGGINFKMPQEVHLESRIEVRNGTQMIEHRLFHEIPRAME